MPKLFHTDRCVNPFKKANEPGHKGTNLRKIPSNLLKNFPNLSENVKVCNACIKKSKIELRPENMATDELSDSVSSMDSEENRINSSLDQEVSMEDIEDCRSPREIELEELLRAQSDKMIKLEEKLKAQTVRINELEEMLKGLRNKFLSLPKFHPLKIRILTIAPLSWSERKVAEEFGASRPLVNKSKKLKEVGGVLAETTLKAGKLLPLEIVKKVTDFYNSDINSRMMPGMKDCVSMVVNGEPSKVQKRLVLMNLKELYFSLKTLHPKLISFSAFCKLRPKNCILAGASGTHSVCVCTIHQNVKLMLDAINVKKLTENSTMPILSYKDCIKEMICTNPNNDCHLNKCQKCPGTTKIADHLFKLLNDSDISDIEFASWTGTDRATLLNQTLPTEEFVNILCEKLNVLKPHSFIAK